MRVVGIFGEVWEAVVLAGDGGWGGALLGKIHAASLSGVVGDGVELAQSKYVE